jgi:hypothetical protein
MNVLDQVLTGDTNTPVFASSHDHDANMRRLVLQTLVDNDGVREVRFERVAG